MRNPSAKSSVVVEELKGIEVHLQGALYSSLYLPCIQRQAAEIYIQKDSTKVLSVLGGLDTMVFVSPVLV